MPIPNHCIECDKPINNPDSWLCDACLQKEREKNMVTTTSTGTDLTDILPSLKDEKTNNTRRQ